MENIKILLGKRIKEIRKSKGLTQEKLAELAGIETPSLSNIENGKNYPNNETLSKISDALNKKPFELFKFEHEQTPINLRAEISKMIQNASDDEIKLIYKIVLSILS